MGVQILPSALKHGFSRSDIHCAMERAVVVFEYEGNCRVALAYVGPAENLSLIEVLSTVGEDENETVFHAMKLSKSVALAARKYMEETT